jgi:ribosomal protein S18 acetylase RimI-like enzyme
MSELTIREAVGTDIDSLFDIRARTRENAIPRSYLISIGITPESWAASLRSDKEQTWVCLDGATPVGFCGADAGTGEIVVLAVLPEYEGRGIGKRLLDRAVEWLQSRGSGRLWLATNPDPNGRAYGFYRSQGWRATGERQKNGDEILVLERQVATG